MVIQVRFISYFLYRSVPVLGELLHKPFADFLKQQKRNLHRKPGDSVPVVNFLD